jgi:hypothetical protein
MAWTPPQKFKLLASEVLNSTPFSLRIFVADGDPDGLRIVDKSNWIGKALVFPRALLPQVKARPELVQTDVSRYR